MKTKFLYIFYKFLPTIKIHCWGGLGSQLYAVILRLELEAKYPTREFSIVCHENGVTQRISEIAFFFPGSVISVEDYVHSNGNEFVVHPSRLLSGKKAAKKLFANLLRRFSIILDGDRSHGLAEVRYWTTQVRGHYSERKLDKSALLQVRDMINRASQVQIFDSGNQNIFVHYRLGDLMNLQEKSPISPDRILGVLQNLHSRSGTRIKLFSDSPDEAENFLAVGPFPVDVVRGFSTIDTLWTLINSHYFIGTNSKISIWAVLLNRESPHKVESYLPYELQHHVIANIGGFQNLKYY